MEASSLWERVEQLVDRAPNLFGLQAHRLHLVATRVWRSRGLPIPASFRQAEQCVTMLSTVAPLVLERARDAYGGRLMLLKGPEAAAWYRHPSDRYFRDLDLLADDADAAQRALVRAGFVELRPPADYECHHHLSPLMWPGIPLSVELHRHPNRPAWLPPPDTEALLNSAVPSATGVDGLVAPTPAAHALLLIAHGWRHEPLGRVADIVDFAALLDGCGHDEARRLSHRWGWDRMWRLASAITDATLGDGSSSGSLKLWARHLITVRDCTVLEDHIARLATPTRALPKRRVPAAVAKELWATASPLADEPWRQKLRRSGLAFRHAPMARSRHNEVMGG